MHEGEEVSGAGISVTLKAAEGFDAPWIVIHAGSVTEAREMMLELNDSDLMEGTAAVAKKFQSHFEQKPRYNNRSGSQGKPAPSAGNRSSGSNSATQSSSASRPQQSSGNAWGSAKQAIQRELGGEQMAPDAPDEVNECQKCGHQTDFFEGGVNKAGRDYGPSYRCPTQGHGSWWYSDRDDAWNWVAAQRR